MEKPWATGTVLGGLGQARSLMRNLMQFLGFEKWPHGDGAAGMQGWFGPRSGTLGEGGCVVGRAPPVMGGDSRGGLATCTQDCQDCSSFFIGVGGPGQELAGA